MTRWIAGGTLGLSTYELIKILIVLLVISGIGIGAMTIYRNVTQKLRHMSTQLFGTSDFVEGFNRNADVLAETPASVSSMTRLMEPQIMRDFPEFSWAEFKAKAENMLRSAFIAISTDDVSHLVNASEDIKKQVGNVIEENRLNGIAETYSDVQIHQTEIANYTKRDGKCIILIQSAVGHLHYKMQDGKVVGGNDKRKTQTKYNVELVYIQDVKAAGDQNALATTCPQCGAPVQNLGAKYCEYCGAGVVPLNVKVWSLHKYYEVDCN